MNRFVLIGALCTFAIGLPLRALAADKDPILFANPLIRDSATLPKLQSLRFVTVEDFAPFSFFDNNNALRGIHVDLARGICNVLKIEAGCTLQVAAFPEVENLLEAGLADVALAGLVPSVQNRKSLGFSIPYFRYPSKFLIQKGKTLDTIASIGVVRDSIHRDMTKQLFSSFKLVDFDNDAAAVEALKAGTISAVFGDGVRLATQQANNSCCELTPENYFLPSIRPDWLSAATAKSQAEILAAVNSALRQMASDGTLDEIYLRQLPVNPLQ